MKHLLFASALLFSVSVQAKLPAPVMDDAAKAKAAETKAKAAHGNKVGAYKLCQWQDKVASVYFKNASTAGKTVKPAVATAPCDDPGPFVWPTAAPAAPKS
ncbi:hypothetical protein [Hydrogenophaga sp.]|uniref:hypothetical protein n=1 Tax=Hydrogenophaga sp. TaxID=1904254 RepID=UPI0025C13453|nr:hypothetical protein [Hydrogenophaga sp.]